MADGRYGKFLLVSVLADKKKMISVFYQHKPIRKLNSSAIIGIGRYEKKLIGRLLKQILGRSLVGQLIGGQLIEVQLIGVN